jgi:hypothetical protein
MTPKEKVMEIYDDAKIWIMNPNGMVPLYYVQHWSKHFSYEHLARRKKTEDEAWEAAWNYIQTKMLKKLESD